MTHYIYRLWDRAGDLLYVGVTSRPEHRVRQHRRDQPWADCIASVTTEGPFDRPSAQQRERDTIRSERPRYNRVLMTTSASTNSSAGATSRHRSQSWRWATSGSGPT